MTNSFPKYAAYGFLVSAVFYLASLSTITYPLTTLFKPLPIICLIYGVLQLALDRHAKILIVAALGFSCLGDIVLTLPVSLVLESGIGFFLVAHCFYIVVLLKAFKFRLPQLFYYLPIFCVMIFLAEHLMPYLGTLLIPVMIYFCILMLMVFSAFQMNTKGLLIRGGAISFMISDLTLAYYLFAYPEMNVRFFIMLTYYMAQGLLTWGLVNFYKKNEIANEFKEHGGLQFK